MCALTAIGALLRFPTLGAQGFTGDEAVTVVCFLKPNLGHAIATLPDIERTPPLYYLLAWAWAQLTGTGEFAARSLSAVLGTAVIPIAYAAGAALVSRRAGLIAAAVVAVHPQLVWYSRDARAYSLLVFLGALSLLFFARALAEPKARNLAAWAVASGLALMTHYFALFLVAPEVLWMALKLRRSVALPVVAVVAAGLAVLPLALVQQGAGHSNFITDIPLGTRVRDLVNKFLVGETGAPLTGLKAAVALIVFAGFALLLREARAKESEGPLLATALGAAAIATPLLLALAGVDYFYERNMIAAVLPLSLGVGAGFSSVPRAWLGAAALCALLATATLVEEYDPGRQPADPRDVARSLGPAREGRVVLTTSAEVGARALKLYRPQLRAMPGRGSRATELVLIGPARPGVTSLRPPVPGFARTSVREVQRLALVRFAAAEPRRVAPVERLPSPFDSSPANNLVERPGHADTAVEPGFCRPRWSRIRQP